MILVAGATGALGSEIVRRLADRGQQVRALVRSTSAPEKVTALQKMGAQIARGELGDRGSLDAACRDIERVASTVSAITTARPGDDFHSVDSEGNRRLIDAATAAGAKQFVYVSFDTKGVPDAPICSAKRDVEAHLSSNGLNHTILHPSLFMETWLGPMLFADPVAGTARVYGAGQNGIAYVATADVAEVAVRALTSPVSDSETITFGGPEQISQREAVEIFSRVFAKPFDVTAVPEEALRAQWESAADPFQKSLSALMLSVARGWGAAPPPDAKRFPMRMTTVAGFAAVQAGRRKPVDVSGQERPG
ncbi:MAG TPA: NmrA family NAD(P)-binding protein [Gemmatimonadaceae bacterium]|nr:NmrA family NAD(P)-binding protein [Gemmatimonadaceae bacterium]